MDKRVNVWADYAYQVNTTKRNGAGDMETPALGEVTGLKLRLSATRKGAAIHADVGNLSAVETLTAGRFAYVVDTALQVEHLLPLGHGARYYAIWSKAGDLDFRAVRFIVSDGEVT